MRARVCVKCARSLLCGLSPFKCLQAFTLNAISKFITATTDQFWWAHLIIVFRCSVFNYGYLHLLSGCNGSSAFAHRIGYSNIHIWWGDTRNIHTIIASLRKKKIQREEKEQPRANAQHAAAHRLKSFKRKENIKRNCLI